MSMSADAADLREGLRWLRQEEQSRCRDRDFGRALLL
jgi:hypothetical protein